MKTVILVFYGSRGDVEPFVALTLALLAETGSNIRLFSDAGGAAIARALLGPRATSPRVAIEELSAISPAAIWAAVLSGVAEKVWAALGAFMATAAREHGPIVAAAAKGADLVFASYLARPYVYAISQVRAIPAAVVQLQPQVPTAAFPHHAEAGWIGLEFGDGEKALGEETSMQSYESIEKIAWAEFESAVADFREQIGAGPAPDFEGWMRISRGYGPLYVFNGFPSPLVAKPEDAGKCVRSVGSINLALEEGYEPPAELVSFLDGCGGGSSAPLYIGWGSMINPSGDVAAWSKLAFHTAHALRKKAVIYQGAAQLSVEHVKDEEVAAWAKENTLTVGNVPHAWLLPRCGIAVHHGGAGTTSAALRAGIPAVITPLFADQYAWGIWVKRNNCGERTGPSLLKLGQDKLICAIQSVQKDWARMKENATQVSTHMGNESGAQGLAFFAEVVGDGKTFFQGFSYEFPGLNPGS